MPKVMKTCKACGKEYEACRTPNPGVFRWRDIACSPECAEKYIHDVQVARGEIVETESNPELENIQETAIETVTSGYICQANDELDEEPAEAVTTFAATDGISVKTNSKHNWNRKK